MTLTIYALWEQLRDAKELLARARECADTIEWCDEVDAWIARYEGAAEPTPVTVDGFPLKVSPSVTTPHLALGDYGDLATDDTAPRSTSPAKRATGKANAGPPASPVPDPTPPPPAKPANPPGKPVPRHKQLLEDVLAAVTGEPFKYRKAWERRLDWPKCLTGGRSRNMAVMALVCRLADALRRDDPKVSKECVLDAATLADYEQANGIHGEELWGEYLTWNVLADVALLHFHAEHDMGDGHEQMWSNLEALAAMWRLMLPGDGTIVVRSKKGKVVYEGYGCRTAGGRKLPKSMTELSFGVGDAAFCEMCGLVRPKQGAKKSTEYKILKALRKLEAIPLLGGGYGLSLEMAKASLRNVRTSVPYVVEHHEDGTVVTYFEQCPSSQTGSVYCVVQNPSGVSFDYMFPYDEERVRENDGPLKNGWGWIATVSGMGGVPARFYGCHNGIDDEEREIDLPLASTMTWQARFTTAPPEIWERSS